MREYVGTTYALDGDTLQVGGARFDLFGIDAPELNQCCLINGRRWKCGTQSERVLADAVGRSEVACKEMTRPGLWPLAAKTALCRVDGIDLGGELVDRGWAVAIDLLYAPREARARLASRGIWRSRFTPPQEWRAGIRMPGEGLCGGARPGRGRCVIKGNISKTGEKIYHVPGGEYYDRTDIDPSKGERWFCSEKEARQKGWRRSRR